MMSAPLLSTSSGRIALTVAAVPTGMNAGVRISPRCMAMTPVRAAPSVAEIEKAKRITGGAMPRASLEVDKGCLFVVHVHARLFAQRLPSLLVQKLPEFSKLRFAFRRAHHLPGGRPAKHST